MQSVSKEAEAFLASLRIPAATGPTSNTTKDEPGGGDDFLIRFTNDDSDSDAEGLRESNQDGLPADAAGRLQQGTGFFPSSGLQRDVKSMPRAAESRRPMTAKEQGKGNVHIAAAAAAPHSRSTVVPQPASARPESEQARAAKGNLPSSKDGPVGGHQVNELEMLRQQIAERESELQRRRQAFGTLAAKAPPLSEGGAATQFPLPRRRQPVHAQEKKQAPTNAPQAQAVAQRGVTSFCLAEGAVAAEAEVSHKEMPGSDIPLLHQTSSGVVRPSSMDRRLPSRSARTDSEGKMKMLPHMAAALSSGRSGVQGLATQTGIVPEEKPLVPQSSTSGLAHGDPHAVLSSEGVREFIPGNGGGAAAQRHDQAETGRGGVTQQGGLSGAKRPRSQSDTGPLPKHSDDVAPRKVARGEPPVGGIPRGEPPAGGIPEPRKNSLLESTASGTPVRRSYAGDKASQSIEDDYVATASKRTGGGGVVAAVAADASMAVAEDLSFAGLVEPHGARVDVVAGFGDGELATSAGPPLDLPQLDGSGALESGRQTRVAGRKGHSFAFLMDESEEVRQQLQFQQAEDADIFPDVSLNGDAFGSGRSDSRTDEGTGGNRSGNEGRLSKQAVGSGVRLPNSSMQGNKESVGLSLPRRSMLQKVREMEAARRGRAVPGRRVERVGGLMSKQIGNSGTVAGSVGFEYGHFTAGGGGLNLEAAEREADELLEQEEKNRRRLEVRERMLRNQLREVGRALKESNEKCEEYRCRRDMAGSQWQSLQALQHPSAVELLSSVSRERTLLRLPAPSDWRDPINAADAAMGPDVSIRTTSALETRVQLPNMSAQPSRIVETTHRGVVAGKQRQDQLTSVRTRMQGQHTGKKFGEQMRPEKENAGVRATLVDEGDFDRCDMVEEVHTSENRGGARLTELPSGNVVPTLVKRTDESLKAGLSGAVPGVAVKNAEREELLVEKESGPEGPRGAFRGSGDSTKIQSSEGQGEETTRKSSGVPLIGSAEESAVLAEKNEPALFSSPKDSTHAVVRTDDAGNSFKEGHVSHAPVIRTGVNAGYLPGGSDVAVRSTKPSHQATGRADANAPSVKESKEVRSGSRLKASALTLVDQPAVVEVPQRKEGAPTSSDTAAAQAVDSSNRDGRPDRVRRRWEPAAPAVSVGKPEVGDVPTMGMHTPREAMVRIPPPPPLDIGNRPLPGPPPLRGRAEEAEALRRAVERSVLDNREHRNTGFGDVPPMMQQGWAPAEAGGREDLGGRGTASFGRWPRRPGTQGNIGDGSQGFDRSYGGQRAETVRHDGVFGLNDGMQQEGGRDVDVTRHAVGKHAEEMRHDVGGRHYEGAWQNGPRYIRHDGGKHMDMRHNPRRHGDAGRHDGWRQDESPRYGAQQADGAHADAMGQLEVALDFQRGSMRSGERTMARMDSRPSDAEEAYKTVGRIGSFKNAGPAERDVRGGALKRKSEVYTNERMNKAGAFFAVGEPREPTFRPQSGDLKRREEEGGIEMERGNVKIVGGVGDERPSFVSRAASPSRKEREEKERRDNMMTERREKDVERYTDRRQREWREREDREQRERDEKEREERDVREAEERDLEGGNKDLHSRKEVQRKDRDRSDFIKERSEPDRVRSRERERDRRQGDRREKWVGIDEERKALGRSPRERHERPLVRGREDKDRGGENRGRERERSADGEGYVRDERRSADAFGGDVRARDGERLADGDNRGKVDPHAVEVDHRGKDKSSEHLPPPPSKRDRFSGKELQVSGEGRRTQRSAPQIEADSGERLGSEDSTDMEERLAKRRRESLWDRERGQGQVPFLSNDDHGRSSKGRGPARSGDNVARKDREGTVDRRAGNANEKNTVDDGPNVTVQDVAEGPNERVRQRGKGTSRVEVSEKRGGDAPASSKVVEDAVEGAGVPRRSAVGTEGHDTSDQYRNVRASAPSDGKAAWGTSLALVAVPEVEDGAGGTQESRVQLTEVLTQRAAHGGNWWQGGGPESGRMPGEDRDYPMSKSEVPAATGSVLFDGSVAGGGSLLVVDVQDAAGVPSQQQDNSSKIDSWMGRLSAAKERSDVAHPESIRVDSEAQVGESPRRNNNADVVTIHGARGESLKGQRGKNEDEVVRDMDATSDAVRMETGANAELSRHFEDLPGGAGQRERVEFVVAEELTPEGGGAAVQYPSPRVKESPAHVMEDTSGRLALDAVGHAVKECTDGQDAKALSRQGEVPGSRHVTDWDLNVPFSGDDGDGIEPAEPASVQPGSASLESPLPMPVTTAEGPSLITADKEPLLVIAAENDGVQEAVASAPEDWKAVVLPAPVELPDIFKDDVWGLQGFAQPIFMHTFNWCVSNTDVSVSAIEERTEAARAERGKVFGSYESPLTMLRSFRANPHFKRMGLSALSLTWSNKVDLRRPLCKFEHRGKCVDRECPGQHADDYVPSETEVEEELARQLGRENNVSILEGKKDVMVGQIGHGKSEVKIGIIDKTLLPSITPRKYLGPGPDGADQIASYRIGNLNFDRLQIPVPGPLVGPSISSRRGWLSSSSLSPAIRRHLAADVSHLVKAGAWGSLDLLPSSWPGSAERSGADRRYFGDNQDRLDRLEAHVLQNRSDWEGWLELAAEIVNYDWNTQDLFAREQALIVLSRGLEANESAPCLWIAYLRLFHQQNNELEREDSFYHAVQKNSSSYELWSMFIDSRSTLVLRLESYEAAIVGLASNVAEESGDKKMSKESVDRRSQCLLDLALQMLQCMCEAECQEEALAWCDELASFDVSKKQSTLTDPQMQKVNSISVLHAALQSREACILWVACAFLALHGYLPPSFARSIFYEQELPFSLDWGTGIMSQDKQGGRGKVELAILLMKRGASILMLDQLVPGQQDVNIAGETFAVNCVRCISRCMGPAQARDMGQRFLAVCPGSVELIHACAEVEDKNAEGTSRRDYFSASINVTEGEGAFSQRFYASYMLYLLRHHGDVAASDCLSRAAEAAMKSLKNSLHTRPPAGDESSAPRENADGRERNDVLELFATFCQKARQGHLGQGGVAREDLSYACVNLALGHALQGNAAAAEAALHDGFRAADCARDKWHLLLELCAFQRGRISGSAVEATSKTALDQLAALLDIYQDQLEEALSRPSLWKAGDMPRLWKLQALVAGPHGARSSSTMHDALLKVWFGEELLPVVEKGKACELSVVALVEALMAKAPSDVRLALATCKSVESAHPSALAWALTLLVSALLSSASPATAPPQAWEYAIDVVRNIGDLRAAEELSEWALYLHPMSTTLWQHLVRVRQALGDTPAADAAIELAEARFNSGS